MEQHINRYTKYINEALHKIDIDSATYKEHLHKVFEWHGCIILSQESHTIVLCWEDVPADLRESNLIIYLTDFKNIIIYSYCLILNNMNKW